MEGLIRWTDADNGAPPQGASDPHWEGTALRPTGMVVFASLVVPSRAREYRPSGDVGCRAQWAQAPRSPSVASHQWRNRVLRSMSWLLGRK